MNLQELYNSDLLIFKAVRGSVAYGTNIESSDIDTHGIYIASKDERFSLTEPQPFVKDKKGDNIYYELKTYINHAMVANPNILDMLYTPDDCVEFSTPLFDKLKSKRDLFITKKCYRSFSGYAMAQIKKAKGKNKKFHDSDNFFNEKGIKRLFSLLKGRKISLEWISNRFSPNLTQYLIRDKDIKAVKKFNKKYDSYLGEEDIKSLLPPEQEDFCFALRSFNYGEFKRMPFRLVPFNSFEQHGIKLEDCKLSSVEHVPNMFRVYNFSWKDDVKTKYPLSQAGVACESISIEEEYAHYTGLFYYNDAGYKQAMKQYHSYWEWMANRNDARWVDQESKEISYDCKNMQHTIRLLLSGKHILEHGSPIVRFSGDDLKFLREIRDNKYEYDYLLDYAETLDKDLRKVYEKSKLPNSPNISEVNKLYKELINV